MFGVNNATKSRRTRHSIFLYKNLIRSLGTTWKVYFCSATVTHYKAHHCWPYLTLALFNNNDKQRIIIILSNIVVQLAITTDIKIAPFNFALQSTKRWKLLKSKFRYLPNEIFDEAVNCEQCVVIEIKFGMDSWQFSVWGADRWCCAPHSQVSCCGHWPRFGFY